MPLPPALRYRDFRLYASGAILSNLGTQFTTVAMAWQMYQLTNSAFQVGLLGLGRALPQIGLALFGGVLADAADRRRILMALQLVNLGVSSGLAVLTLAGLISPTTLLAAAVLFAFSSSVETPTRQAVIPNLVDRLDIGAAIAFNGTQRNLAKIVGPAIAGVMLAVSGPGLCYALDATSWFAMLAALALIRKPLQGLLKARASVEALLAGARFVASQQVILAFMVLDFGAMFFGSSIALLPIYARDILAVGPVGLGLLYAAPSVGAVLGAALMSTGIRVDRAGMWVLIGFAAYGLCTIGFALSRVLWLSLPLLAGTGLGDEIGAVLRNTSNQLLTPDELRGRVAAVNGAFVNGGPQLGQFESGVVAALGGVQLSALTGGIGAVLLVAAVAMLPKVRRFTLSAALQR
ncbi:MAG TPA: MFS transporter [Chloroflexota bacterium]|jgi:MFS family permease